MLFGFEFAMGVALAAFVLLFVLGSIMELGEWLKERRAERELEVRRRQGIEQPARKPSWSGLPTLIRVWSWLGAAVAALAGVPNIIAGNGSRDAIGSLVIAALLWFVGYLCKPRKQLA